MRPFIQDFVPDEDQLLFQEICNAMAFMPDVRLADGEVSCHMVTRALASVFPQVRVRDGDFRSGIEHSWLETLHDSIIDPYPVWMLGGPILVHKTLIPHAILSPWTGLYSSKRFKPPAHFKEHCAQLERAFKEVFTVHARNW